MSAYFGPGGNSEAFKLAGYKSTLDAPRFVKEIGLDAYEYEAGNGLGAGAIIGIVSGAVVLLLGLGVIVFWLISKRRLHIE